MVLLIAAPILQRLLSEMCQDLAPDFSFVLKKTTSTSVSCASYQGMMPGRGMLNTVLGSSVCVEACICVYVQKKCLLWEHSPQAHGDFLQIGAYCRFFALCCLDAVVRDCNASQQLHAPVSSFFTGFSLSNICRKGQAQHESSDSSAIIDVLFPLSLKQLRSFWFSPPHHSGSPPASGSSSATQPTHPAFSQLDVPGVGGQTGQAFCLLHLNFPSVSAHQDLLKLSTTLQTVIFQILERWPELQIAFEKKLLKLIVLQVLWLTELLQSCGKQKQNQLDKHIKMCNYF